MTKSINQSILVFIFLLAFCCRVFANDGLSEQKIYSLDDCVSKALKVHPKIKMYEYKTDQKMEKDRSVTAENFPQVNAAASYDRLSYVPQMKQRFIGDSDDDYQADIVVTQPLFTGGKMTSQKQSARYGVDAAEQGHLAVKENVIFGVKAAYFKLLFARDIVRSKEDLLKYAELSYSTALDLHKRTKTPREETLLRLEVRVNEVRQELITAQNAEKIAQKALLNAMGLESGGSMEIQDLKDDYFMFEDMPVEVAHNYEIAKLSKEVKEADEQIKIARSGFFPQISARYSYGYEWGDWSRDGETDWIAGVAIDLNVWDWGKTKADVKQAKAYREELQSYESLLNQQIGLELESARLKYKSALSKLEIAQKSCEQAQRSLDLFTERYRDALITSLELLDSQSTFSEAQANCAEIKLELRLAKAEIEKIAGNGYDLK